MKSLSFSLSLNLRRFRVTFFALFAGMFLGVQNTDGLFGQDFKGSASFMVEQRFFEDERIGKVNGFSEWGAYHFDLTMGLYEFDYRIEPILSLGYIKNRASLFALDNNGDFVLEDGSPIKSEDTLGYTMLSWGGGVRWKPWDRDFLFMTPIVQTQFIYRFAFVQKNTFAVGQQTKNKGGDFGMDIGGGVLISFFYDKELKNNMISEWDLKDYGLLLMVRYLPGGWFKHGLGLVSNTGGWSFGGGLHMDW